MILEKRRSERLGVNQENKKQEKRNMKKKRIRTGTTSLRRRLNCEERK
jgi:hypothetical protein